MNLYPFRYILPKKWWGKGYEFVTWLKKAGPFKWAHFDVYMPSLKADKIILCFGQIHTVASGKMSRWTSRKIAKVQARLFTFYSFLLEQDLVHSFGVEGLTDAYGDLALTFDKGHLQKFLHAREQNLLHKKGKDFTVVKKIFLRLAGLWRSKLLDYPNNPSEVLPISSLIDGVRMLVYLEAGASIYPIEGEKEYQFVAKRIRELQDKIHRFEHSSHFHAARQKKFKKLNAAEYKAVQDYNRLVQSFNLILKAPLREEAHLQLAERKLHTTWLTSFVMGIGHRHNLLIAARKHLSSNTCFVIITPQELWLWKAIVSWFWRFLFLALCVGIYYLWSGYLLAALY